MSVKALVVTLTPGRWFEVQGEMGEIESVAVLKRLVGPVDGKPVTLIVVEGEWKVEGTAPHSGGRLNILLSPIKPKAVRPYRVGAGRNYLLCPDPKCGAVNFPLSMECGNCHVPFGDPRDLVLPAEG